MSGCASRARPPLRAWVFHIANARPTASDATEPNVEVFAIRHGVTARESHPVSIPERQKFRWPTTAAGLRSDLTELTLPCCWICCSASAGTNRGSEGQCWPYGWSIPRPISMLFHSKGFADTVLGQTRNPELSSSACNVRKATGPDVRATGPRWVTVGGSLLRGLSDG